MQLRWLLGALLRQKFRCSFTVPLVRLTPLLTSSLYCIQARGSKTGFLIIFCSGPLVHERRFGLHDDKSNPRSWREQNSLEYTPYLLNGQG